MSAIWDICGVLGGNTQLWEKGIYTTHLALSVTHSLPPLSPPPSPSPHYLSSSPFSLVLVSWFVLQVSNSISLCYISGEIYLVGQKGKPLSSSASSVSRWLLLLGLCSLRVPSSAELQSPIAVASSSLLFQGETNQFISIMYLEFVSHGVIYLFEFNPLFKNFLLSVFFVLRFLLELALFRPCPQPTSPLILLRLGPVSMLHRSLRVETSLQILDETAISSREVCISFERSKTVFLCIYIYSFITLATYALPSATVILEGMFSCELDCITCSTFTHIL